MIVVIVATPVATAAEPLPSKPSSVLGPLTDKAEAEGWIVNAPKDHTYEVFELQPISLRTVELKGSGRLARRPEVTPPPSSEA